jgi:hypothetical protein
MLANMWSRVRELEESLEHFVKSRDKWMVHSLVLERFARIAGIDVKWMRDASKYELYETFDLDDDKLVRMLMERGCEK